MSSCQFVWHPEAGVLELEASQPSEPSRSSWDSNEETQVHEAEFMDKMADAFRASNGSEDLDEAEAECKEAKFVASTNLV